MLGFKNGCYDLNGKEFVYGNVGYEFPDKKKCKMEYTELKRFLRQVLPDKETRRACLRAVASCLGGGPDGNLYVIRGDGENGKDMFQRLCMLTFGSLARVIPGSLLTQQSRDSNLLLEIEKCRQCWMYEPDTEVLGGNIKELVSGERLNVLYGTVTPQFKIFMNCNTLPKFSERVTIFEFSTRFVDNPKAPNEMRRDPNLVKKLNGWVPAFMCMLLKYYKSI